jgi:uridine monophosphate synthetase
MQKRLSYAERARYCKNNIARELFTRMHEKQTNLSLSCDVTHAYELLAIADLLGPEICVLKTHIDIIQDFSIPLVEDLEKIAQKHGFFIFEDRKFADIGNTVKQQYAGGVYHIADWAHIVNAHTLPGPGIVEGLMSVGLSKNRGLLLLASMSSAGNLLDDDYAQKTLHMAEQFPEFVIGFIAQKKLSNDPQWIYMTPGVQLEKGVDVLGQQYVTPESAIQENGSDIIIVGRGILNAKDPLSEAKKYREAAWLSHCG